MMASASRMTPGFRVLFVIMLVLSPPLKTPVAAQAVQGSVLDERTGVPVSGASIMLLDSDQRVVKGTLSDSTGSFLLVAPRTGRYALRLERIGYEATASGEIDLLPPDTVSVELRMAVDAVVLAPLTITSPRGPIVMDIRLARWGYYDRRAQYSTLGTGITHFFDYEDIKKRSPSRVSDMFADIHGVRVTPAGIRGSNVTCTGGGRITYYLDGQHLRLRRDETIDDYVLASWLSAIEVYVRGSYPAQYAPRGGCASVVIWTGWVAGKGDGGG